MNEVPLMQAVAQAQFKCSVKATIRCKIIEQMDNCSVMDVQIQLQLCCLELLSGCILCDVDCCCLDTEFPRYLQAKHEQLG